ncbi:MAG: glucose 1-dehydrogenase [Alphaproteobacteria bacterium]|nr:glucose 1-dehydrogenase [Alphaproteobacteria bacterium]
MSDWLGLEDKVCVITGAGGGIGRDISLAFAEVGARVVALDNDRDACAQTANLCTLRRGGALSVAFDVRDPQSITHAKERTIEAFGRCDVLVNNAAILRSGDLETLTLADWEELLAVNLTGYLLCAQSFGRAMLQQGSGAIVHVASIGARQPQAFSGAYSVSKAGVVMLSRQIATEWGPRGIRSNVVSPGLILTAMSGSFYTRPGIREDREKTVPLRRLGTPSDVASLVVFLASDRSLYVTGQEIVVDGGFSQTLLNRDVERPVSRHLQSDGAIRPGSLDGS